MENGFATRLLTPRHRYTLFRMNPPTVSSLYECKVNHTRTSPKNHSFTYRVFMLAIDLDHFPKLPLLSKNRFNLFSIHDSDHLHTDQKKSTRQNLTAYLTATGTEIPEDARITLLTFPRVLGYAFNPVSFYYIFSRSGEPIAAVAEVTNTYREMKIYPLGSPDSLGKYDHTTPKEFYVSPFSDPNDTFHFRIAQPSEKWNVTINNLSKGKPTLLSSIIGEQRTLSTARLAWFALKYPFLSLGIIFGIHFQALLLFLKKIPHFPKSTPVAAASRSRP